jgi:hypothetical protein
MIEAGSLAFFCVHKDVSTLLLSPCLNICIAFSAIPRFCFRYFRLCFDFGVVLAGNKKLQFQKPWFQKRGFFLSSFFLPAHGLFLIGLGKYAGLCRAGYRGGEEEQEYFASNMEMGLGYEVAWFLEESDFYIKRCMLPGIQGVSENPTRVFRGFSLLE